jgi:cytosine/adenosine deaminase-related metal-dependent hydrolase
MTTRNDTVPHASDPPPLRALKARYVFPVAGEPIADGRVTIRGERIVAVGCDSPAGTIEDFGNAAILPGLVNAHTHLEFSDLAGPLGKPRMPLAEWIGEVVRFRREGAYAPQRAVRAGLAQSLAGGTTALGEIAQPDWDAKPFASGWPEATVFLELIASTAARVDATIELAEQHLESAGRPEPWLAGLSPHAPYSVHPRLLRQAVELSRSRHVPLAMHLAESREEVDFLRSGAGPFRDLLERLSAWDAEAFPGGRRPLDYLRDLAQAHRTLVIHGNYLDDEEIAFAAAHADRMAVVYCPRTHAYFAHAAYPLQGLLAAGTTVALGTDSRASSPDLSVLAEMRFAARTHPAIEPAMALRLGTLSGAKALGRDHEIGSIEPGKRADLAAVVLPDRDASDPHELLFDSDLPVVATWCRGKRIDD